MKFSALAVIAAIVCLAGCNHSNNIPDYYEKRITEMEQDIKELKHKQERQIDIVELFSDHIQHSSFSKSLVSRYLKCIALPQNPTREQVIEYINSVYQLRNINTNSSDMIRANIILSIQNIGHDYLPDLMPFIDYSYISDGVKTIIQPSDKQMLFKYATAKNSNSAYQAMNLYLDFVDESDKETIIKLLPENTNLVSVIRRLGLEKEAAPILKEKFLKRQNINNYDTALEIVMNNIDEKERSDFIEKVWRNLRQQRRNDFWGVQQYANIFASYGYLPAFEFMADNVGQFRHDQHRQNQLVMLTPVNSYDEFLTWYKANKGKLKFNESKGIFEPAE